MVDAQRLLQVKTSCRLGPESARVMLRHSKALPRAAPQVCGLVSIWSSGTCSVWQAEMPAEMSAFYHSPLHHGLLCCGWDGMYILDT